MGSIELGCGCCLYREPEDGTSSAACVRDSGYLGSEAFCAELEEEYDEMTVVLSSVLTRLVRSEAGLLRKGEDAGDWDLRRGLRLAEVLVVVGSLPAGPSETSTSREEEGEAALPVAEEAGGVSFSLREGLLASEE